MKPASRAPLLLLLPAGFVVWSVAFVVLYAAQSVGCAAGWDARQIGPLSALRLLLFALWLAHIGVLVWLLWLCRSVAPASRSASGAEFLKLASVATTAVALVATFWIGIPILGTSLCR